MRLRRILDRLRRRDWGGFLADILVVVIGIFLGLQASQWAQAREERSIERGYLERLLADSEANLATLERAISFHDRRAAIFESLAAALKGHGTMPSAPELSEGMCRWFVQPAAVLRRGTYAELISSGRLALLRDAELRGLLAYEQALDEETRRLDMLATFVSQAAAPVADHREWHIVGGGTRGVECSFDVAGMQADPRIPSVVAQLYRDQTTHRWFRQQSLDAARATTERLRGLVGS